MKDKTEIKRCLERFLNREALPNELLNAEKDSNILIEVLESKLEELEKRVKKLEGI